MCVVCSVYLGISPLHLTTDWFPCIFNLDLILCCFELGLSLVEKSGGLLSCCRARASIVAARGLSSCGTWASLLLGMWNLLGLGIEPVSPALAGAVLSTVPPGKCSSLLLGWC